MSALTPVKLLAATDFDGTLFRGGAVSAEDRAAINAYRAAGGRFGFVTGRGADFFALAQELGLPADFFLLYNGALLALPNGAAVKERLIPRADFAELTGRFRGMPQLESFDADTGKPFYYQYYARFLTGEQALAAAAQINEAMGDRVSAVVNGRDVNVGRKGSGKAQGVFDALAYFGLQKEAAAVFGDDLNDLDMIITHRGWAVANARREVLAAAPHICASVGEALRSFLV